MSKLNLVKAIIIITTSLSIFSCEEEMQDKVVSFRDSDQDGFGDPDHMLEEITIPEGYVDNNLDCNDSDPHINPDAIEILNNDVDENCDGEIEINYYAPGPVTRLITQEEVDEFGKHNYKYTNGNLIIGSSDEPNESITSLLSLSSLQIVRGNLTIHSNHSLTSLQGLNNLRKVDIIFTIIDNPVLEDLSGLENIEALGDINGVGGFGELLVKNNNSLTSIIGLQNLNTWSHINVVDNPNLYNFCSIEALQEPSVATHWEHYNYGEEVYRGFSTSGNKWNPDISAMRNGFCQNYNERIYDSNTIEDNEYLRYVFLRKGENLTSIEGILTDFGSYETSPNEVFTFAISEITNWYIVKIPQNYNEIDDYYTLINRSNFYDPSTLFPSDDNYSEQVVGLSVNPALEAYAIYKDGSLRYDLGYSWEGSGTFFGRHQNEEAFALVLGRYIQAMYPEIKSFDLLLEELNIELNTLNEFEFREFDVLIGS